MTMSGGAPVIVVAGPTASGKSALAVEIAEAFRGTVINADSMQIYADLRVLTARPSEEETRRAPHRLYGVLDGSEKCSAGRWREMAMAAIARTQEAGRLPVLCGGTGLYLRALMHGIAPVPPVPEEARAAATALHAELGGPAFHALLAARDPVMAARLHPGNTQRLIRAWEVLNATGRSLADWQAAPRTGAATGLAFLCFVLLPERAALHAACDGRFRRMVEARGGGNALDEVRALVARGLDPALPIMKALGVRELAAHLAGDLALEDAIDQAQRETRRYAKRQVTWFRHQMADAMMLETGYGAKYSVSPRDKIFAKIRQSGLTATD